MQQQIFTLNPPSGTLSASGLGFTAAVVIVDNYTSSYVNIPDAGATLPPWVYGAVISLPPGITQARASLTPTTPAVGGPSVPVSQCTLKWTDEPIPASSGHLLQQSQYATRQKLYPDGVTPTKTSQASITINGNSTNTVRFTLPSGTTDLRLLANAGGLLFSYQLFVGGHQSNEQYYGDTGAPGSPLNVPTPTLPFTIPVEVDWDSQVDVSVVNTSSNTISAYVSALFQPETPGQAGSAQSVTIVTPQPWQAPTSFISLADVIGSVASGTTIHAITNGGSQTIYLFGLSWTNNTTGQNKGNWQTTGGTVIHGIEQTVGNPAPVDFHGLALPQGAGLDFKGTGGTVDFMFGSLTYSKQ